MALATIAIPGAVITASAADQSIMSMGSGCAGSLGWSNANPTISAGDTVTWSNCASGFHQLQSTSSGWCLANNATAGLPSNSWTYVCKFTGPGAFSYQCAIHGAAMAGTITVSAPTPTPTPTPTRSPSPVPSPRPSPQPTPSIAPAPSPSASLQALATAASPSDPPVTVTAPLAGRPSSTVGSGSPLPTILGAVIVAALGGGAFYWFRLRPTG